MKNILVLLALLALAMPAYAQKAEDKFQFTLTFKQQTNGLHIAVIEGKAEGFDGAELFCDCSYEKKTLSPNASEPPNEDDYKYYYFKIGDGRETVSNGKFKFTFGYFPRKMYSGSYRVTVIYDPAKQAKEIVTKFAEEVGSEKTFQIGDESSYNTERDEEAKRMVADFERYESLIKKLKDEFGREFMAENPDIGEWKAFVAEWRKEYDALEKDNNKRFEEPYNSQEADAKYFIGILLNEIKDLEANYGAALAKPKDERDAFDLYEEDARGIEEVVARTKETLGMRKQLDGEKVRRLVEALDGTAGALEKKKAEILSSPIAAKAWGADSAAMTAAFGETLFALKSELGKQARLSEYQSLIRAFNKVVDEYARLASGAKGAPDAETKAAEDDLRQRIEDVKKAM